LRTFASSYRSQNNDQKQDDENNLSGSQPAQPCGWYGYTDRHGHLTHTFIGAAYKGFFHVPRSLFFCQLLIQLIIIIIILQTCWI